MTAYITLDELLGWTADKLLGLAPLTPAYKLRYSRYRYPPLQSG